MRHIVSLRTEVIALALFALVCSCQGANNLRENYTKRLDTLERMLRGADQKLILDPVKLRSEVDSMKLKANAITKSLGDLSGRNDEVGFAFNYYVAAIGSFDNYLLNYDPMMFDNGRLRNTVAETMNRIKEMNKEELEAMAQEISDLEMEVKDYYNQVTELTQQLAQVLPPLKRKKAVIERIYKSIKSE